MASNSFISTQTGSDTTVQVEKDVEDNVVDEIKVKRGWRFNGTFACLAILNLICSIDATILSVALPVRYSLSLYTITLIFVDNCHRPKRNDSSTSFLVRDILPPLLNRLSANMGFILAYHRPQVSSPLCTITFYHWYNPCLCRR
jgi:hypothetical protein